MNAIYLRRRLKVVIPAGSGGTPVHVIAALQKNIEGLGFLLSEEVCGQLERLSLPQMEGFYKDLIGGLHQMVGADREFRPMYPNFPAQVMEMSEARLYRNAIFHYCTNRLLPFSKRERKPLSVEGEPKVIGLGSREDLERIFTLLVSAKTVLSGQDKEDVVSFVCWYRDRIFPLLPDEIPGRENLAVLGAAILRETGMGRDWLSSKVKTATDVLRLAVAMSGGDVSLAEPAKFGSFKRTERKLLLSWIERCGNPAEDMLRWKGRWIRLGERLHPGEFAKRFPKTCVAFDVLRNDLPFETFNAAVERHLAARDGAAALALLESRPGELIRRLDHLLRTCKDAERLIVVFRKLAAKVATPPLLQAMTHFANRSASGGLRTFFPKGDVAKVQSIPDTLPALPAGSAEAIAGICVAALIERFSRLPSLGRCYLDPALVNYLVPFSQRSAGKALRTLVRGSRLPLPASRFLRFFLWWQNGSSRTDIDLSAALYCSDFFYVDVLSYYNLKNFGGCHSGDIVDAPEGAAEFIDLDVERTSALGVRYIVMSINSYTQQPYCDLPECFAGWMARSEANSGEIFEPRTLQDKVDIASRTRVCLPAVFDLEERCVIWADIALRGHPYWNNVENNQAGVSLMLRAIARMRKTTLHTLFRLHIAARGELVGARSEADRVFAVEEGLTPFNLDQIAADYL